MAKRPQFVVDWDGTLTEDSWPRMGAWLPGAPEAMRALLQMGAVVIDTCRVNPYEHGHDGVTLRPVGVTQQAIQSVRSMLDAEGLHEVQIHTTPGKPPADEYIDNKARRFTGRSGSWPAMVTMMQALYGKE